MAGDTSGLTIGLDVASYGELSKMLYLAERRERELKRRFRQLISAIEDRAAHYGTAAATPVGCELSPGSPQTRTNRVKLTFLSCGLNEAADLVRLYAPRERRRKR